jgi:hypothetical protein
LKEKPLHRQPANARAKPVGEDHFRVHVYKGMSIMSTATCRICGLLYVSSLVEDQKTHAAIHKKLASGSQPQKVRDFSKAFGWAVAHNDGGLECAFHAIRPPSPPTSGHLFHAHPARQSERSDAGLHC